MLGVDQLAQKIENGRAALLLVDMQLYYLNRLVAQSRLLNSVDALLEQSTGKIAAVHVGRGDPTTKQSYGMRAFSQRHVILNDTPQEIFSVFSYELPHGDAVLFKRLNDAFELSNLKERLEDQGIDTVILGGIYAEACILETGEGAKKAGLNVGFASELIRGYSDGTCHYDDAARAEIHKNMYKDIGSVIRLAELYRILKSMPIAPLAPNAEQRFKRRHLVAAAN